ncbi:hypothetical protein AB0899_08910 [Streptomyces sp. NPDC007002]|uniref:hypothetical protein n=1 Tax=Streptomyces sp. NPDC007002 TaxID=3156910 RepID=UPI003452BA96
MPLVCALALSATGCSDSGSSPSKAASSRPAKPTATDTPRAEHIEGESVTTAPKPVGDGSVLLSVASRKGNAQLPLNEDIGAGRLAIQVNCQGQGKIQIAIDPTGLSFPLDCVEKEVSSTYNEVHLKRERKEGTVRVTAPAGIRWAVTVEQ